MLKFKSASMYLIKATGRHTNVLKALHEALVDGKATGRHAYILKALRKALIDEVTRTFTPRD